MRRSRDSREQRAQLRALLLLAIPMVVLWGFVPEEHQHHCGIWIPILTIFEIIVDKPNSTFVYLVALLCLSVTTLWIAGK